MLLALLPALLASSGCGNGDGTTSTTSERGAVTVGMDEYRFVPDHLVVRRSATLVVRNEGEIAHNLAIERGPNPHKKTTQLAGTSTFLPGKSERLRVNLAPGRYAMACTVVGHRQLGMVGTVTVK